MSPLIVLKDLLALLLLAALAIFFNIEATQARNLEAHKKGEQGLSVDECAEMQPNWVFCNCFEDGNLEIWDDYDGNPPETNLLMADPGPLDQFGNHVLRLRAPPGGGTADLVKELPDTYDRLYARWYVKWEEGYDFNARNHGSGLFAGERNLMGRSGYRPDGSDRFISLLDVGRTTHHMAAYTYYRGMYQDCVNPDGACWGDNFPCTVDEGEVFCEKPQHRETVMPPVMESGRWYCIEMMIDAGTPVDSDLDADGILNWWIDGIEIGPWTDLWFRTTPELKIRILWLSLFHHGDHSLEGIMIDNVVVSTSRIGFIAENPDTPVEPGSWGSLKNKYH